MNPWKLTPYLEMDHPREEDHPLDTLAQSRISSALCDQVVVATKALVAALDGNPLPWLELEALLNQYRQQREEILYNLGHEHGYTAGSTQTLSRLRHHPTGPEYHVLSGEIQKQLVLSSLPRKLRIAVLLEIAMGLLQEPDSTQEQ